MKNYLLSPIPNFTLIALSQVTRAAQFDGSARVDVSDSTIALSWNATDNAVTVYCWFKLSIPSTATLVNKIVILANGRRSGPSGNFVYLIQFNISNL